MIVTVPQLKEHLRIETNEEDAYLETLIAQAQAAAETFCKCTFSDDNCPQDVRLAVILYASRFYEVRDNYDKQSYLAVDMAWKSLLWPHRDPDKLF